MTIVVIIHSKRLEVCFPSEESVPFLVQGIPESPNRIFSQVKALYFPSNLPLDKRPLGWFFPERSVKDLPNEDMEQMFQFLYTPFGFNNFSSIHRELVGESPSLYDQIKQYILDLRPRGRVQDSSSLSHYGISFFRFLSHNRHRFGIDYRRLIAAFGRKVMSELCHFEISTVCAALYLILREICPDDHFDPVPIDANSDSSDFILEAIGILGVSLLPWLYSSQGHRRFMNIASAMEVKWSNVKPMAMEALVLRGRVSKQATVNDFMAFLDFLRIFAPDIKIPDDCTLPRALLEIRSPVQPKSTIPLKRRLPTDDLSGSSPKIKNFIQRIAEFRGYARWTILYNQIPYMMSHPDTDQNHVDARPSLVLASSRQRAAPSKPRPQDTSGSQPVSAPPVAIQNRADHPLARSDEANAPRAPIRVEKGKPSQKLEFILKGKPNQAIINPP
jgi:hypothetical protein